MKILRLILLIIILLCLIIIAYYAILPNSSPYWTGFGAYDEKTVGPRAKTLWDWLDLLIIPTTIGIIGWMFKEAEKEKAKKSEEQKNLNDNLDAFFKIMTELITNNELLNDNEESSIIARTRTILAFDSLDGVRKGQVLQFLYESNIIKIDSNIILTGANLKNAKLDGILLKNIELKGIYFNNASLKNSFLDNSFFSGSDLSNVDFTNSSLQNTDLSYTNLTKAKLSNLDLTSVNFEGANLSKADLRGSKLKKEQYNLILKKEGIKIDKNKLI